MLTPRMITYLLFLLLLEGMYCKENFTDQMISKEILPYLLGTDRGVVHVIMGCLHAPKFNVIMSAYSVKVTQLGPKACSDIRRAIRCKTNDYYIANPHHNYNEECNKALNVTLLYKNHILDSYLKADKGAIGFPVSSWESDAYLHLHNDGYLVAISPRQTLDITENKKLFQVYMQSKPSLKDFIPIEYTLETAVYPLIVKLRPLTGTNSKGVLPVYNASHLRDLLHQYHDKDEPYLLQEAVLGNMEIIVFFVAYAGKLLDLIDCRVLHIKDPLTILTNDLRSKRVKMKCADIPGFEKVALTIKTMSADLNIDGLGFLQGKVTKEGLFKVFEVHTRVPFGLLFNPKLLASFFKMYWLAREVVTKKRHSPIYANIDEFLAHSSRPQPK